jgi:hypothetical protein
MKSSEELIELMDVYFPCVLFASFDDNGVFPDIKQYFNNANNGDLLDIKSMSAQKRFFNLFPDLKDREQMTNTKWDALSQNTLDKKPNGGVMRHFVDEEDDRFLEEINSLAPAVNIRRSPEFSIPDEFFNAMEDLKICAVYDSDDDFFEWNFSALIRKFKPKTPYAAYQRYAHGQYTRVYFGAEEDKNEKRLYELLKKGNKKLLDELKINLEKLEADINKAPVKINIWETKKNKVARAIDIWDLAEDALQSYEEKEIYKPSSLEKVSENALYQQGRYNKMRSENYQKGYIYIENADIRIFEHNDEVNIANIVGAIMPLLPPEEQKTIGDSGHYNKVKKLYMAICDPDIRAAAGDRRCNTIRELYRKMLIARPEFLDDPVKGQDGEMGEQTLKDLTEDAASPTLEQFLLMADDQEFLYGLFERQFPGSLPFLDNIRQWIMTDSPSFIAGELNRYLGNKHNADNYIFKLFCMANKYDQNDPDIQKIRTNFANKIKKIAEQFGKTEV